jgi:hypothetical protein
MRSAEEECVVAQGLERSTRSIATTGIPQSGIA